MLLLVVSMSVANGQTTKSPYVAEQQNELKSLTPAQIDEYLQGKGMGFAKAAELNSYPGPKHVLELAQELQLSQAQRSQTEAAFKRMHRQATRLGKLIVANERDLNALFSTQRISEGRLERIVSRIAQLQGDLRVVHLKAHLEMKRVLSASQIKKYDELRGYGKGAEEHQHKQHGSD
jgi:hypothetical protein